MDTIKWVIDKSREKVTIKLANRSLKSKIIYLRKKGCMIGEHTRILGSVLDFGTEPYLIKIGDKCLFSGGVLFFNHDAGTRVLNQLGYFGENWFDKIAPIKIGDNVFIGNSSIILAGSEIGDNSIIGAGSIVSGVIPSYSVAVGIPAKVICTVDEYYNKNLKRGTFYPTQEMSKKEKKEYLLSHINME